MNVPNPKRSSRLAAKEQREIAEPKDAEADSRKRGRDKCDNFSSIYKRATPASSKKATQNPVPSNEIDVPSPGGSTPIRSRERNFTTTPQVLHVPVVSTDQKCNGPSMISESPSVRVSVGNGLSMNGSTEIEKDIVQSPAQRAPNNLLVTKLKESQRLKGAISQLKAAPKPSMPHSTLNQQNLGQKNARLQTNKQGAAPDVSNQPPRIGQPDARFSAARPDRSSGGSEFKLLNNERAAAAPAHVKPGRHRGSGASADHGPAGLGNADNEDLRRRLGGAVERWISARSALPGGEGDDLGGFRPEIERLVKLIAFEAFEIKQELDESEDSGGGAVAAAAAAAAAAGDGCGREVTTTRFRLEHPEVKAPFVFESTQHTFSGSVLGAAAAAGRHRLEGLRWKVEFELIGFFVLALHTQTYEVDEDVEIPRLEKVPS
jgi:hypothetical protein